jgi:hypothetical protein
MVLASVALVLASGLVPAAIVTATVAYEGLAEFADLIIVLHGGD